MLSYSSSGGEERRGIPPGTFGSVQRHLCLSQLGVLLASSEWRPGTLLRPTPEPMMPPTPENELRWRILALVWSPRHI